MTSESELKTALVKSLRGAGWYARRIEDKYAVGIPDLLIGIPYGPTVMVEAKLVRNQTFEPSPRQFIELQRWENKGGNELGRVVHRMSWLLGFKEGLMYLHECAESATLSSCLASVRSESDAAFFTRFLHKCLQNGKLPSA